MFILLRHFVMSPGSDESGAFLLGTEVDALSLWIVHSPKEAHPPQPSRFFFVCPYLAIRADSCAQ